MWDEIKEQGKPVIPKKKKKCEYLLSQLRECIILKKKVDIVQARIGLFLLHYTLGLPGKILFHVVASI